MPELQAYSFLIGRWLKSRHTTRDVIANFEDLKVLGKGDFKSLMKWRLAIRLETGLDVRAEPTEDVDEEVTIEPMDEDEQISDEVGPLVACMRHLTKVAIAQEAS